MTPSPEAPKAFLLRLEPSISRALDERAERLGQTRTGLTNELLRTALGITEPEASASSTTLAMANSGVSSGPRTKEIHLRLTEAEFAAAQTRARGWRSVGAWGRSLMRSEIGNGAAPISDEDRVLLSSSIRELRRLGINLNQVAHRLNSDARYQVDGDDVGTIAEVLGAMEVHIEQVTRTFSGGSV